MGREGKERGGREGRRHEGRRKGREGSTQYTSDCLKGRHEHELWADRHPSTSQPLRERLKHPSLSPESESAPHCRTTALGRYTLRTCSITLGRGGEGRGGEGRGGGGKRRGGEGRGVNRQRNSHFSQLI